MISKQDNKLASQISDIILDFTDDIQMNDWDLDRSDLQGITLAMGLKIVKLVKGTK